MWTINPVLIITFSIIIFCVSQSQSVNKSVPTESEQKEKNNGGLTCENLLPVFMAIICFLSLLIFILLILLFKMFTTMQKNFNSTQRRDTIQLNSINEESTALHPNNSLCVSPTSGDGADNSSSTSSGTPGGSLADLSNGSQRYVSLQECQKMSDYINVSESAASARADCKSKPSTDIDYVNVKEPRRKKGNKKGRARCDAGTTSMSEESDESSVNYSKVVFTSK